MSAFEFSPVHLMMLTAVLFAVLIVEAGFTWFAGAEVGKKRLNRRMSLGDGAKVSQRDILIQLRKERGMDENGNMLLPVAWLNRLIVQSGLSIGLGKAAAIYGIFVVTVMIAVGILTLSPIAVLGSAPVSGILVPYVYLRMRRGGKMNKFGKQLPEAIDLITRSLKAGHPVPVAISMVAREMPDPIGSEFGMVADEVTYGSDLVTALSNLYERVGHPDLPLLVSSVSIQSTTGGNLREILDGLSKVVRDRLKMKAKVKAISAEGRMSAIFLTAMPVILFIVLNLLMPEYYSGIWDYDEAYIGAAGLIFWLTSGNLLIMKMVSFKV